MRKIYAILACLATIAVAACAIYAVWAWKSSPAPEREKISEARISEIKALVELSTVDIYEEIPMKASVGDRHIVAVCALEGHIDFNLDSLRISESGDTLVVTLPPAEVTLRESTRKDAYRVIDEWNGSLLGRSSFTTAEENEMKRQYLEAARRRILRRGYAARAEREAAAGVSRLLEGATGRPVKVIKD